MSPINASSQQEPNRLQRRPLVQDFPKGSSTAVGPSSTPTLVKPGNRRHEHRAEGQQPDSDTRDNDERVLSCR